jgi:hypothetical protein
MSGAELAIEVALRLGLAALEARRTGELGPLLKRRVGEILPSTLRTTIAKAEAEEKAKAKYRREA